MSMFKRIAVTNRSLCSAGLEEQVEKICKERLCEALILREKDLSEQDYLGLEQNWERDTYVWVSVHTVEEAVNAEKLGANALIAGHIFMTDCKKGLAPRGLDFLKDICRAVSIPVFAIGGIDDSNSEAVKLAGAQGECRMSWYMRY